MIAAAEEAFGRVDVVFNNAGIMHSDDGDAVGTTEAIWDLTMDVNAKGVFLGCKYGIPALQQGRRRFDHQHGLLRCPPRCGNAAGRLHRLQGCRAGDDAGARRGARS